jgi:hypothetical protein
MAYTISDMVSAQAELDSAQRRADDYDGNNPDKHRASLDLARLKLQLIVSDLQRRGIVPKPEPTEERRLSQTLDEKFPNARSRDEVEHEGKRYRLRFAPARMSRSRKTVVQWSRWWEEVE